MLVYQRVSTKHGDFPQQSVRNCQSRSQVGDEGQLRMRGS
jgi:hypothetical protein